MEWKAKFQKVNDSSIDTDRLWVWNKETNGIGRMSKKHVCKYRQDKVVFQTEEPINNIKINCLFNGTKKTIHTKH